VLRELRIRGHLAHRIEQAAILLWYVLVADYSGCGTGRYEQGAMVPYLDREMTSSKRVAMTETDVGALPLAPNNSPALSVVG
jgi:hypothetical protein